MGTQDPSVDAYIERSADFAQPILRHLRALVHRACPEVSETMKWSCPHFDYGGSILCSMASFKSHCAFGFWKGSLIVGELAPETGAAAGQFGRIESIADLPPDEVMEGYVRRAMELNEQGVKSPSRSRAVAPKPELPVPSDLAVALKSNAAARRAFDAFSPSHRREYLEWITEAKSDATRARRIQTAIEWMAEGKSRNWKYTKR